MVDTIIKTLIETNSQQSRLIEAQRLKIERLESVLEQRVRATKLSFDPNSINNMCLKVYQVFLANPGIGFTYDEFEIAFKDYHGWVNAHTPQRIRDLRKDGLVWSDETATPKKFYLKLKELGAK